MKPWFIILPLLFAPIFSKAQKIDSRNAFYVELLGNGMYYSLNYDRILASSREASIAFRSGFSLQRYNFVPNKYLFSCFPLELNSLLHPVNNRNMFELGIGCTPLLLKTETIDTNGVHQALPTPDTHYLFTSRIGYRYQSPEKGVMYRLAVIPIFTNKSYSIFKNTSIWYGVSIGYCF